MVYSSYENGLFTTARKFGIVVSDQNHHKSDVDTAGCRLLAAAYRIAATKLNDESASKLYEMANDIDPDFKGPKRRTRDISERMMQRIL